MRNFSFILLTFFIFSSCSSNDEEYNHLQEKLIGEWVEYGYYWINKGGVNNPDDTTYYEYEEKRFWEFNQNTVSITNSWKNEPYAVINDSLKINNTLRHVKFINDSCILTSAWGGTYNTVKYIYVLHPRN